MMDNLELKLFNELSPGSIIICCRFPFPNRKASSVIGGGIDTVWVYRVGCTSNGATIMLKRAPSLSLYHELEVYGI